LPVLRKVLRNSLRSTVYVKSCSVRLALVHIGLREGQCSAICRLFRQIENALAQSFHDAEQCIANDRNPCEIKFARASSRADMGQIPFGAIEIVQVVRNDNDLVCRNLAFAQFANGPDRVDLLLAVRRSWDHEVVHIPRRSPWPDGKP